MRKEESRKYEKLLREALEKQTEDSEKQRRREILEVQTMTTEKLDKILNSHEQSKQAELLHLREQHQRHLRDAEFNASSQVRDLTGKLGDERTENENQRSLLMENDERRHRLEQDLRDISKKERQISQLQDEISGNKEALLQQSGLVASLQERLDITTKNAIEIGELKTLLAIKKTDVSYLKGSVDKLTSELSITNNNLRAKEQALCLRVCEIEALNEKLASQNTAKEQETKRRQELETQFNDLKLRHDECTVEIQRLLKIESELSELRQIEDQRSRTGMEVNRLKESLIEAETKNSELESETVALKAKVEKCEEEIKELESDNNELVEDIMDVGKIVSEAQAGEWKNARMAADAPRLRRERNELRTKVSVLELQMSSLTFELSTMRAETVSSENKLKEEIERLKSEQGAADLEAKLKESKSTAAKLRIEVSRLETKLKLDIDPVTDNLRSVASDLRMSQAQVQKQKEEIVKLKDENAKLKASSADEKKILPEDRKPKKTVGASEFDPELYSVGTVSGGGIITDFNYYSMMSDCARYKNVNDQLKQQLTALEKKYGMERETNFTLQRMIQDFEKRIICFEQQALVSAADVPRPSPGILKNRGCQNQPGPVSPFDVRKLLREVASC